ncbi:MAG: tetratricopeptide repeat protein, partial [Comamonadaceae bacterium]|nr:tetratricopeptide repeat protein [Comamonadaceae bacterium]
GLLTVDAEGRFGTHPLVAAYAAERLADDRPAASACARRHAAYYARAVAALAARAGSDTRRLTSGLELEFANARLSWRYAVTHACFDWLAASVEAWRRFFELGGRAAEGIAHFRAALDLGAGGRSPASLAAAVRSALARLHYLLGEHGSGLSVALAGAELAEQCDDRRSLFQCLTNAGSCHAAQAQWSAARALFERTLAIGSGDAMALEIATAHNNLGIVAKNEGRWDEASTHYELALAIEREQGRNDAVVRCLSTLGGLHLSRGHWESARRCMDEGLRLSELHRIDFFVPVHACGLGEALLEMGKLADAQRLMLHALERCRSVDNPMIVVNAEANLGRIAMARGERDAARQHLRSAARGAAERGWTNMGLHLAMLFGAWMAGGGRRGEAAAIWRMVCAHPQADAGMRTRARGWLDTLAPHEPSEPEPPTLAGVTERLLSPTDTP